MQNFVFPVRVEDRIYNPVMAVLEPAQLDLVWLPRKERVSGQKWMDNVGRNNYFYCIREYAAEYKVTTGSLRKKGVLNKIIERLKTLGTTNTLTKYWDTNSGNWCYIPMLDNEVKQAMRVDLQEYNKKGRSKYGTMVQGKLFGFTFVLTLTGTTDDCLPSIFSLSLSRSNRTGSLYSDATTTTSSSAVLLSTAASSTSHASSIG